MKDRRKCERRGERKGKSQEEKEENPIQESQQGEKGLA